MNLRKTALILLIGAAGLISCAEIETEGEPMNQSQVDAKIDSLVSVRLQEVYVEANEDLDRRKSIDVKVIADSIVRAKMNSDADNTLRNQLPTP